MQTFENIQQQVGEWSRKNFGWQETPYLSVYGPGTIRPDQPRGQDDRAGVPVPPPLCVGLGSLAPLLGLVEEVGEMITAEDNTGRHDAIGDIAIYLCDYCSREGIPWPGGWQDIDPAEQCEPFEGIVGAVGAMAHCHLKRHQRIRGFHDHSVFLRARGRALRSLIWHLDRVARAGGKADLLTVLNETWTKIVKKRDWKSDAVSGGAAAEGQGE